ncbi:ferrous iron transport protein A [Arcobacter sp. 15-2]|uniref:FeoA family protein n=1 Tax=Arcobacter sp. 15-2 TaxID=3374109 RepID=UPI00399D18D2
MQLEGLNLRLDSMNQGQKVKVVKIHTKGKLMHKLLDMGFVNGSDIEIVREAPLFDPMELKIHNYNISLRKSEANLIEVIAL